MEAAKTVFLVMRDMGYDGQDVWAVYACREDAYSRVDKETEALGAVAATYTEFRVFEEPLL